MNLSRIKICIFDVNGVLIDSNLANARAMGQAFTDDPVLQQKIAEFYLTLTGIDRGEKIRRVQSQIIQKPFEKNGFELCWKKLVALTRTAMTSSALTRNCKGILNTLGTLHITRVALSNTPLKELRHILAAQTLESHLDIIRGGGNWPKTESLKRLLDEFKLFPDDCLFVGDGKGACGRPGPPRCHLLPSTRIPASLIMKKVSKDHLKTYRHGADRQV